MLEELLNKFTFGDALITLISAFAIISFWRGIWGLLDLYLLPNNYKLSLILSVLIGIVILLLTAAYKFDRRVNK